LEQLAKFLDDKSKILTTTDARREAEDLKERLCFVGKQEFALSAASIARIWQGYLEIDRGHQILLPVQFYTPRDSSYRTKSQTLVLSCVLDNLSDQDCSQIALTDFSKFGDKDIDFDGVKVIWLDDWLISGNSIRMSIESICRDMYRSRSIVMDKMAGAMAIHLLGAVESISELSIVRGLSIPVTSIFHAKPPANHNFNPHPVFSGTHSSSDYGFGIPIYHIKESKARMPWLAQVVRTHGLKPWEQVKSKLLPPDQ